MAGFVTSTQTGRYSRAACVSAVASLPMGVGSSCRESQSLFGVGRGPGMEKLNLVKLKLPSSTVLPPV